jgi:hypothetical protein
MRQSELELPVVCGDRRNNIERLHDRLAAGATGVVTPEWRGEDRSQGCLFQDLPVSRPFGGVVRE